MLEQLVYKNHLNQVFEFGKNGIYVNENDLHNYEWQAESKGSRISGFNRQISTRSLPIIIICKTEQEGIQTRNRLFEVVERDVLAMKHGQIIIGGYYFKCFVTKSTKASYLVNKRYMSVTLTLTTDYPYWVRERTMPFYGDGQAINSEYLDYAHDYPLDYCQSAAVLQIVNDSLTASNFKLVLYGACSNPSVSVGNHRYKVNYTLEENEHITIDSISKTVTLTGNNGDTVNLFNFRDKESYIFEKIPVGNVPISWAGSFAFDLILMDERSEPRWT